MILKSPASLDYIPKRIISLVPSQTELLHDLGLEAETIGITKFCIHPGEWFRSKIRIGGTKALHIEKITALDPDLIIANKEENVKEQVEALAEKFPVFVTDVNDLPTALQMIDDIGSLTGKTTPALSLIEKIKTGFSNLPKPVIRPKTAYMIWKDPWMTIGGDTFIHNMLEAAGFENIFGNKTRYPEINIIELSTMNCELVLLSSEPYPFKQKHIDEIQALLPGTKILLVDGEMFSWYGSRLLHAPGYFNRLRYMMYDV